jgi:hypothetical protein
MKMAFKDWPLWKRALFINIAGVVGVALGFATSDVKLSPSFCVPVAVFVFASLNLISFSLLPRIAANRTLGQQTSIPNAFIGLVRERSFIFLLLINQLIGASQLLTIAVSLIQVLVRRATPPTASAQSVLFSTLVIIAVAAVWTLSALGLWRSRAWAWWLALALNGIHVLVIFVAQYLALFVLGRYESLVGWSEIASVIALIVLMLPIVRAEFRGSRPRPESALS